MAARASGGGGNDYAHFTEATGHLLSAEEHFNKAKALFTEFKQKYPQLADIKLPAQQLRPAEPLSAVIPQDPGNLYQRRMMTRESRGAQFAQQNAPAGAAGPFDPSSSAPPPSPGVNSASFPSYQEPSFPASPPSQNSYGGYPQQNSSGSGSSSSSSSSSSYGPTASVLLQQRQSPPQQQQQQPYPNAGPNRQLNFGPATPEPMPRVQNMVGSTYFDTTVSSNSYSSGGGRSDLQESQLSQSISLPRGETSYNSYTGSSTLPSQPSPPPTYIRENVREEDLGFDPTAERYLAGGSPPPSAYYENMNNSMPRGYQYGGGQMNGGQYDPCSLPQNRGIMEETPPVYYDSSASYGSGR